MLSTPFLTRRPLQSEGGFLSFSAVRGSSTGDVPLSARSRVDTFDEEEPCEAAEGVVKKQDVISSTIGRSYNFTVRTRDVLKCGPHPGCWGCMYNTVELATRSGHSEVCKTRMMEEMEEDVNKHRVRKKN